ncbi:MAG: hypothetical protein KAU46_10135 [Candidatus Aminicenantes bacterium]|nr:hypothetical protein [Candidatus Aminicenantes bacterium]
MNKKRKKFTSLFLVFSLVALSGNLMGKERKGVKLDIQKIDGQKVNGELITVKPDSLLLLDSEGVDVSVDIKDVESIKILKKSKAYELGLAAFLVGATIRGVGHSMVRKEKVGEETTQHFFQASIVWGFYAGVAGIIIGMALGIDKTIKIEGKSDVEIDAVLEKLRKKARIRNYQ